MAGPLKKLSDILSGRLKATPENVRKLVAREAELPTHEMAYKDIEKALKKARVQHDIKWKFGRPSMLPPKSEQIFDFDDIGAYPHAYLEAFDQPITTTGITGAVRPAIDPQKLQEIVRTAKRGAALGRQDWYDLSPVGRFALEEIGKEDLPLVQRFLRIGVPFSQRTAVPEEIIGSSRIHRLVGERGVDAAIESQAAQDIVNQFTGGAGTSAKLENVRNALLGRAAPPTQVKLNAYGQARAGNLFPPAMDSKVLREMGLKENIGAPQKGASAAVIKALAARTGIEPAKLQAMIWEEGIGNRYTRGAEEPLAATINNLLYRSAKLLGEDPKKFAVDVLSGKQDIPYSASDLGYRRGGPVKMAGGGALTRYVRSLLPESRRMKPLTPIRGGTGRQAFWLGDDEIAKIARLPDAPTKGMTYRGLFENTLADDPHLLQYGLLPEVRYKDPLGELLVVEGLKKPMPLGWRRKLASFWEDDFNADAVMHRAIDFDPRLEPFRDYDVLAGDFTAPRHWRSRPSRASRLGREIDNPVLIDEGSLSHRIWDYEMTPEQARKIGGETSLWDISDILDRRADFLRTLKRDNRSRVRLANDPQIGFDFKAHGGPVRMAGGGQLARVLKMLKSRTPEGAGVKRALSRLEQLREAVPESDRLYQAEALHDALMSPKSRLAVYDPGMYEKAAFPLERMRDKPGHIVPTNKLDPFEQARIESLMGLISREGVAFDEIPELYLGTSRYDDLLIPTIKGHEGRHRSRALKALGHDRALLNLHGFPSAYTISESGMERAMNKQLEAVAKGFRPGKHYVPQLRDMLHQGPALEPYDELIFGKPWKRGGPVKLNREYPDIDAALKQARKLLDPQRFAVGGKAVRNFLRGVSGSNFDEVIARLKKSVGRVGREGPEYDPEHLRRIAGLRPDDAPRLIADAERYEREIKQSKALQDWIDRNLSNYLTRQHGTPEDPLAQLFAESRMRGALGGNAPEEQILLAAREALKARPDFTSSLTKRPAADWFGSLYGAHPDTGVPEFPFSDPGMQPPPWFMRLVEQDWPRHWSDLQYRKAAGDIDNLTAEIRDQKTGAARPEWRDMIENKYQRRHAPPVELYDLDSQMWRQHGQPEMSDVFDYLRTLPPESLNRVSVPQAVRSSRKWHEEMAKKAEKAAGAALQNVPVSKEYPTGWRWLEFARKDPNELPVLKGKREIDDEVKRALVDNETHNKNIKTALQDVGKQLGHCYQDPETCESYLGSSKLYSLIDPKGKARATIEVEPNMPTISGDYLKQRYGARGADLWDKWLASYQGREGAQRYEDLWDVVRKNAPDIFTDLTDNADNVVQIRGRQFPPFNARVEDDAQAYIGDFLNSRPIKDIREAEEHAGLMRVFTEGKGGEQRPLWMTEKQAKPFERYKWYPTKPDEADPRQWWANKDGSPAIVTKDEWIELHKKHTGDQVPWSPPQNLRTFIIPDDWKPEFAEGGAVEYERMTPMPKGEVRRDADPRGYWWENIGARKSDRPVVPEIRGKGIEDDAVVDKDMERDPDKRGPKKLSMADGGPVVLDDLDDEEAGIAYLLGSSPQS